MVEVFELLPYNIQIKEFENILTDLIKYSNRSLINNHIHTANGCIKISIDDNNRNLCIYHNGTNLTKAELCSNTIVYNIFPHASNIEIISKEFLWRSDIMSKTYTIEKSTTVIDPGILITIKLNRDVYDNINEKSLRTLMNKTCSYITYNIYFTDNTPLSENSPRSKACIKTFTDKDCDDDNIKEQIILNKPPIWNSSPNTIDDESYKDLYSSLCQDSDNTRCISVEQFKFNMFLGIIFCPDKIPNHSTNEYIFINNNPIITTNLNILPDWLCFLKIIVNSYVENLPVEICKNHIIDKSIAMLTGIDKSYLLPFNLFITKGILDNNTHRDTLFQLTKFTVNKESDNTMYIDDICKLSKNNTILYASDTYNSPLLETHNKNNDIIILITNPFESKLFSDENILYKDYKFKDINHKDIVTYSEYDEIYDPLCNYIKNTHKIKIMASNRLIDTPCIRLNNTDIEMNFNHDLIKQLNTMTKHNIIDPKKIDILVMLSSLLGNVKIDESKLCEEIYPLLT